MILDILENGPSSPSLNSQHVFLSQHVSMPLRKEESWPQMKKRKHVNSSVEEKDGLIEAKFDENANEAANESSVNEPSESEQNKKV